jgi:hypothetical protein
MTNKNLIGVRTYAIAQELGIPQTTILNIINNYIAVLREEIIQGREIRVLGLVSIIPDREYNGYISTTAHHAKEVSGRTASSYYTCLNVIELYIKSIKTDILNGVSADIRGVCSFTVVKNENAPNSIYSNISVTIKRDIEKFSQDVFSIRTHTSKLLKFEAKNASGEEMLEV